MKFNLQKITLIFSQIIWLLPFLTFCIGYYALQFFMIEQIVQAPDLIGKDLLHATKISSDLKLNLRIIAEKEIADAVAGTIIKQNPLPQTAIKAHQSIFIVITKLPDPVIAPTLIHKKYEDVEKICKEKGIKNRNYFLPTHHPTGHCFAQMPAQGIALESKKMSCYISTGNQNQYVFPDFTNLTIQEVVEFLQEQNIKYDIYYKDQKIIAPYKKNLKVSFQKPLAGTLFSSHNGLYVQLQVT